MAVLGYPESITLVNAGEECALLSWAALLLETEVQIDRMDQFEYPNGGCIANPSSTVYRV